MHRRFPGFDPCLFGMIRRHDERVPVRDEAGRTFLFVETHDRLLFVRQQTRSRGVESEAATAIHPTNGLQRCVNEPVRTVNRQGNPLFTLHEAEVLHRIV